jgi:hypothetical protein
VADESKSNRSGDSRRRRRYFKRKGDGQQSGEGGGQGSGSQPEAKRTDAKRADGKRADAKHDDRADFRVSHDEAGGGERRNRNVRKRRRSRSRRSDGAAGVGGVSAAAGAQQEIDYTAPDSVYVYEHLLRPSSGSNYEFRSEHLSKVGRTLEDYSLDLSIVFDPPAREPVGQIIARVFAEFEAADAVEAARAEALGSEPADDASATPLSAEVDRKSAPWLGPNPEFAGSEVDETQEEPPKDD